MGAPPIRNGVAIGHFDMTLPRSSQGSERPGQNGERQVGRGEFRVPWRDGETLGDCGDVPHHIIQTTCSLSSSV